MEVRVTEKSGIVLMQLTGRVDTSTAPDLEKEINRLIDEGKRKLLVDMAGVVYISSGGLRVLLATAKKLRGPEDRLGLCCLSPEVNKILRLAGFTTIFPIFSSEGDAIGKWG